MAHSTAVCGVTGRYSLCCIKFVVLFHIYLGLDFFEDVKRDPFFRFISIHDMNTHILTDYEALVGFVVF